MENRAEDVFRVFTTKLIGMDVNEILRTKPLDKTVVVRLIINILNILNTTEIFEIGEKI